MKPATRLICGWLLFGLTFSLSGCGTPPGGEKTPEAVFDRFKSALKNKDYRTAFAQTTPESQDFQLAIFAMVAPIATASNQEQDQTNAQKIKQILQKVTIYFTHHVKSHYRNYGNLFGIAF